jgi:hypothetical protein
VIGIYGNTSGSVGGTGLISYGAGNTLATVFGNDVPLNRTGMQADLGSISSPTGMHDIWQEPGGVISRIEFSFSAIPEPAVFSLSVLGMVLWLGHRFARGLR